MPLTTRQLRLGSGLVMLTYVTMHLGNHMLGIVSLPLAEQGLRLSIALWRSWPGTVALYGAFCIHFALALRTIYQRAHWRLPAVEWLRLWSGFSLPLLLIGHAVNTRVAASFYGLEPSYEKIITNLVASGSEGWQIAMLAPGWVHGCLGLWIGLRHHAAMRRARPLLVAFMVTVPLLSAAGFVRMSLGIAGRAPPPVAAAPANPDAEALARWRKGLLSGYLVLLAGTFVASRRRDAIRTK